MFYNITVNWIAILVAAVASFAFGWVWHMLCGKTYQRLTKTKPGDMMKNMNKSMGVAMLISFIGSLVSAYFLAFFIGLIGASSAGAVVEIAFLGWAGFLASTTIMNDYAWKKDPFALHLLNAAFWLGNLMVISLVLFYLA